MQNLNKINISEIELLKSLFGIEYSTSSQKFKINKALNLNMIVELYNELKNTIWTSENIQSALTELEENPPDKSRLYYFNPGYPIAIDDYLSKMGILNYEILIEDPLCFPLTVKPTYSDHILKNPSMYVKHIYENALFMIYLEEWIKNKYLYFVPSLPLFDMDAFWQLAKASEELDNKCNLANTKGIKNSIRFSIAESTARLSLDMMRMSQNHYTETHIKKIFPEATQEQTEKILKDFKSQSLEQREQTALNFALSQQTLTEQERQAICRIFSKSRPFNIERFLDISKLDGNLITATGMPLLHAAYISERMQCIPTTDNLGLMYGYEGWCEGLGQSLGKDFEKVRAKVDLPFAFFDNVPISFVHKSREEGKGIKTSQFLEEEWQKIRTSTDLSTYATAAKNFSITVQSNFSELEKERDELFNGLHSDVNKTVAVGLGAFIIANITTEIPISIAGSILTMLTPALDTYKSYKKSKREYEVKPLAVFIEAKEKSTSRK